MDRPRYLHFGEVALDFEERSVSRHGLETNLPEEYWNALMYLIHRKRRWVSKDKLFRVLGVCSDGTLTQQMHRIRGAFGDNHRPYRFIDSRRNKGYRWIADSGHEDAWAANLYLHPNGYFQKEGPVWREHRKDVPDKPFTFKEFWLDKEYIYLCDETRLQKPGHPMLLRIPISGGTAQWTFPNPIQWEDCLLVKPQWEE